ncbi:MAG: T9SS type A sorting domain-containing protein [Candidatus Bipolaricaulia bacterium]
MFFVDVNNNDNFDGTLSVTQNNFHDVSGQAVSVGNNYSTPGEDIGSATPIDATSNYYGASDGPTAVAGHGSGAGITDRTNVGGAVPSNETALAAFVPFWSSANAGSASFPDAELIVDRLNGADETGRAGDANFEFETLSEAKAEALPGETIVVEGKGGGNYTTFGGLSGLGDAKARVQSGGTITVDFTIRAEADVSNQVTLNAVTFNQSAEDFTINVTSGNGGFFRATNASNSVRLQAGTAEIVDSGALEVAGGGEMRRDDGSFSSDSQTLVFAGADVDVTYDQTSGGLGDITTGPELPSTPDIGTLTIGASGDDVRTTFDVGKVTAASISIDPGTDATFNDELEVETDVTSSAVVSIGNGSDLSVEKTFTASGAIAASDASAQAINAASGTFNGDPNLNSPGGVVVSNYGNSNVANDIDAGNHSQPIIEGDGSGTGNGVIDMKSLTIRLNSAIADQTSDNKQTFRPQIRHINSQSLSNPDTDISISGTVDADNRGSDDGDQVFVRFRDNGEDNTVIAVGGGDDFAELNSFNGSSFLNGTIRFTGDATVTYGDGDAAGSADVDLADGSGNGGAIEIKDGATLTIENNDSNNTNSIAYDLGQTGSAGPVAGSFSGSGTLALSTTNIGGSEGHTFNATQQANGNDITGSVAPAISISGGTVTFDGGSNASDNLVFDTGPITVSGGTLLYDNTDVNTSASPTHRNTINGDLVVQSDGTVDTDDTDGTTDDQLEVTGTLQNKGTVELGEDTVIGDLDLQNGSFSTSSGGFNNGLGPSNNIPNQAGLEIVRDFTLATAADVSIDQPVLFSSDATDATITLNKTLRLQNDLIFDKGASTVTVTGQEAIRVAGNVNVTNPGGAPKAQLKIKQGSSIRLTGNADLHTDEVDGSTKNKIAGDGEIVFVGNSTPTLSTNNGSGTALFGNIESQLASGNNIDVTSGNGVFFTGTLSLVEQGVAISGSGNDLSPRGDSASVKVDVTGSNTTISTSNGTYNAAQNTYNLEYFGDGSVQAGSEAGSDFLGDLTVASNAKVNVPSGPSPVTPTGTVTINGTLGNAGSGSLELGTAGQTMTVDGAISSLPTSVTADGAVTINGSGTIAGVSATSSSPSTDLSISGVTQVGTVTASGGNTVSLSLTGDPTSGDQRTSGGLTVNGGATLSLGSDIDVRSGGVNVNPGSNSSGTLALGSNTLTVEDGNFNGTGTASYTGKGTVVLATDDNANSGGQTVPNVTVTSGSSVTLNGVLAFDGTAKLNASLGGGSGDILKATGSTVSIEGTSDLTVPNFTVESGNGGTTTLTDASDSDNNAEGLIVSFNSGANGELTLASGTLDHGTDVEVHGNLQYEPPSQSTNDFTVTASGGSIVLNSATATLNRDLTIPSLETQGSAASSLAANANNNPFNLTVGSALTLDERFNTDVSNTGDLIIGDGGSNSNVQITRTAVYESRDVLDQSLTFESSSTTYDLTYSGDASAAPGDSELETGFEASAGSGRIDSLKVNLSGGNVEFESDSNFLSGDVTVNERFELLGGTVRHTDSDERQIVIADGATLLRDDGQFAARANVSDAVTHASSSASYTLVYADEDNSGNSFDASSSEFLDTGRIALETRMDDGNANNTIHVDVLPGDRTVTSFTMDNGADDDTRLQNTTAEASNATAFELTVEGGATLSGGAVQTVIAEDPNDGDQFATIGNGTLDVAGNISVGGATVATDVEAASDFTFNAGNLAQVNVAFDGGQDQAFTLANSALVNDLTLDQDTSAQHRVTLSGASVGVSGTLTFNSGLLEVADGQLLALGQTGSASNGPFGQGNNALAATIDHSPASGVVSHVVGEGSVQHGIAAGTPTQTGGQGRFEWPVGTPSEYRPASITFTENDPIDTSTNIRIDVVDESPGGTGGLASISDVASYPAQYWDVEATTGVSASQTFDIELETATADFTDKFNQAANLRIIRRFDGDASQNDYKLQGQSDNYQNALFNRNGEEYASVRSQGSTGGLVTQGTFFTLGLPGRLPQFTQAPARDTTAEGQTLTTTFEATARDLGQDVTLSLDSIPGSVDADSVSLTVGQVSDTTSAQFEFTPSFQGGTRDLEFVISASDSDGTRDTTYTVTVNDDNREPAFTQALGDTTITDADTLSFTYQASDPDGESLGYGLATAPQGASIDTTSGQLTWSPSFSQVGSTYDVAANVTDGEATVASDTAQVTVEPSLARGDVDGDADTTQLDAAATLSIYLGTDNPGTPNVDESSPTAAQMFAADFNDNGNVNPFDASLILQEALGLNSGAVATASAKSSASAQGSVRLKGMDRKDNTATIPVVLSDGASGVQSVAVEVKIDPSIASVANVSTNLPEGWIADHSVQDGTITVGMAGTEAIGGGQIGKIQLKMSGDASVEPEGQFQLNAGAKQSLAVDVAPDKFALNGNYPNPVESSTTIEYSLKKDVHVEISVYDALGRKVSTVVDEQKSAGRFEATLDAGTLSSGVYFYRIQAGDFTATKKMTVIR